ncbi:hypothetical protein [Acidiphilium sp. JA12-A1]|uniref:hypothetical protein n=1 Tax=Acidiphilium sp. JA12-A1 TaxID=1464546 RepID=UPI00128E9C6E|nr:hypothetical protein [Acidiphilium sp. JA12-A1]
MIEAYCQAHQYTISAFGSVSTFAAVVVSLWLARRADLANRTRLRASFEVSALIHELLPDRPTFVTVSIVNIGNLPLIVPVGFLRWRLRFSPMNKLLLPIDRQGIPGVLPAKNYPIKIEPRSSETFFISECSEFVKQMQEIKNEFRLLNGFFFYFRKAVVITQDGSSFRVEGDQGIANFAASYLKSRPSV